MERESIGVGHLVAYREVAEQIAAQVVTGWRSTNAVVMGDHEFQQSIRPHETFT